MRTYLLTILLALPIIAHCAPRSEKERIAAIADSTFHGRRGFDKNKEIIGASIGIYWKGETYLFNYGLADRERNIPVSNETQFEIGSNTKVFTGLLLANELVSGRVTEQTFIDKYVKVNKNIQNKIKLVDLADYTSGLPTLHDSASQAELEKKDSHHPLDLATYEYVLKTVANTASVPSYGEYEYNNLSFGLLGYILCKANNATYDALLKQNILTPLGMLHTYATTDSNDKLARGYDEGRREPFIHITGLEAAGLIKADMPDMMRFIKCQVNGGCGIDNVIATANKHYYETEDMTTALGWHITRRYGSDYYVMRGDTYGASSAMAFSKDRKFGMVIMLNSSNSRVAQSVSSQLLTRVVEGDPEFTRAFYSMHEVKMGPDMMKRYTGTYKMGQLGLEVSVKDNKLFIQMSGQEGEAVKPVGNNTFQSTSVLASFEFVPDGSGNFGKLLLHQNGQDIPFVRE
jgi:CubicO group peptidase (beta-lactamase class C family)